VGCLVFAVKCPGAVFVSRREVGVLVMKGPMRRDFLLASMAGGIVVGLAETLTRRPRRGKGNDEQKSVACERSDE
jgi:hypothetical protein